MNENLNRTHVIGTFRCPKCRDEKALDIYRTHWCEKCGVKMELIPDSLESDELEEE